MDIGIRDKHVYAAVELYETIKAYLSDYKEGFKDLAKAIKDIGITGSSDVVPYNPILFIYIGGDVKKCYTIGYDNGKSTDMFKNDILLYDSTGKNFESYMDSDYLLSVTINMMNGESKTFGITKESNPNDMATDFILVLYVFADILTMVASSLDPDEHVWNCLKFNPQYDKLEGEQL